MILITIINTAVIIEDIRLLKFSKKTESKTNKENKKEIDRETKKDIKRIPLNDKKTGRNKTRICDDDINV